MGSTPPTKACPFCGETILAVAVKCKHCGEFLSEEARKELEVRPDAPSPSASDRNRAAVGAGDGERNRSSRFSRRWILAAVAVGVTVVAGAAVLTALNRSSSSTDHGTKRRGTGTLEADVGDRHVSFVGPDSECDTGNTQFFAYLTGPGDGTVHDEVLVDSGFPAPEPPKGGVTYQIPGEGRGQGAGSLSVSIIRQGIHSHMVAGTVTLNSHLAGGSFDGTDEQGRPLSGEFRCP